MRRVSTDLNVAASVKRDTCINSGIRRIGVLTQYKAHSLILHIQKGWGFLRGEFNEEYLVRLR